MQLRREVWTRLGADLKPPQLDAIASREVPLGAVIEAASLLMERRALGRILVGCREPWHPDELLPGSRRTASS